MGNSNTSSKTKKSVSIPNSTKVHHHHNFPSHPPHPSHPPNPSNPPNLPSSFSATKPLACPIKPPIPFMTEEEFCERWNTWKKQFLRFKTQSNRTSDDQHWGDTLLNLMGPIGQHIYKTFTFESSNERQNVNVLIDKFDEYSIFSTKKRLVLEDVYEYVNDLQVIVNGKNISNADKMIRKRILNEIDEHQFTNVAKNLIPTFVFLSDFNKLTIKEIAFIWKLYIDKTCKQCGNHHTTKCPALDKQCSKCNKLNHFSRMCPEHFISSCKFCGGSHERKKCPAFNEICTKCNTRNHFSWKCQPGQIVKCRFCDMSHPASRAVCPAKNVICRNCQKKGHIALKCKQASGLHRS
ncbi:uncharacterized protein LOC143428230 [Xylocopa sonorina]|uniref:uncharacterized protein LOC143428230 n=1 Tax=Xylocopa sonorina TaxID=1818115 RepID=UPI00403ACCE2